MFSRVLIANRGEIAVRVLGTLRRLGIEGITVFSDADADAPHVRLADRPVRLGPAPAGESYLSIERILEAARLTGAEAIHPGYGFLSERPAFARACAEAGLAFIGPSAEAMALLGDKVAAKAAASAAGVPVVPGLSEGADGALTDDEIIEWVGGEQLPVLLKAAAGGGGKGMRVVRSVDELPEALGAARREATAAFGDDRLLVERYLEQSRHIEVQLIADAHGTALHLGERECSLQRRHQKVIEEAPSPVVSAELRERMGSAACALARAAGYVGAGTVELIAERDDPSSFYFLEVNARLQVEHPVTEAVTGLDLVELQLRVAAGEPLPLAQSDVSMSGHAVEARVYAEDPASGFLPSTGRVVAYRSPAGVRVDSGIEAGSEVTAHYDPLLAKAIASGSDRAEAFARLDRALAELRVVGPTTNAPWLRALLARPEVRSGDLDTELIERLGDEVAVPATDPSLAGLAVVALLGSPASDDPWDSLDGWRLGGARAPVRMRLDGPGGEVSAVAPSAGVRRVPGGLGIEGEGAGALVASEEPAAAGGSVGLLRTVEAFRDGSAVWLVDGGVPTRWAPAVDRHGARSAGGSLDAPMPGTVIDVRTEPGATVAEGDTLVVLESMKMELAIQAPSDGVVADVFVATGDRVAQAQPLVALEPGTLHVMGRQAPSDLQSSGEAAA
ncbi:MAG TPA: biotin carboxylase N-terminal domain-containing protein [Conexibacter sp.]|nr:biotin carboxylase N-terminal domain-containing protein [Conexibacter sp.]